MAEWRLVGALSIGQLVVWGALYYGFAVIVTPMEADLGWAKTQTNGALTLGLLVAGVSAVWIGQWIDRRGAFWPMTLGSVIGGALLVAWSFVDAPWQFYVVWAALGVTLAALLYEPAFAVIAANVADWRRGILYLTFVGGLASTAFVPLAQWLVETWDWRIALRVLGAIVAIVGGGIHLAVLPGTKAKGEAAAAADASSRGAPSALRAAMARPAFWGIAIAYFAYNFVGAATVFHLIPILAERAVPAGTIVAVWATIGPMQVAGRVALMVLGHRVDARSTGRAAIVLLPISVILLAGAGSAAPILFGFAIIYGASNGMFTIVRGTIVPEIMGPRGYATINGALSLPSNTARAMAPVAAAVIWGWGGYAAVLWVLLCLCSLATVAFWMASIRRNNAANTDA
ncbi:MAG: MFS transporter [Proteobacteria bacterium]|nr:MFS transporter [Pseudomonadota bacterium]